MGLSFRAECADVRQLLYNGNHCWPFRSTVQPEVHFFRSLLESCYYLCISISDRLRVTEVYLISNDDLVQIIETCSGYACRQNILQ